MATLGGILLQSFGDAVFSCCSQHRRSNTASTELMERMGDVSPQSFDAHVRSRTVQGRMLRFESVGDRLLAQVATLGVDFDRAFVDAGRYIAQVPFVKRFEDRSLREAFGPLTVFAAMSLFYGCFDLHCGPALRLSPCGGTSITFHICSFLAMAAYYQAVLTDPGGIPEDWEGQPDSMPRFVLEGRGQFNPMERKRRMGGLRYCNKELKFKPDRAHYCKAMDRNVLRMDHYCPWLNNCVGHRNHKFFILFLGYTSITTLLTDVELMKAIIFAQRCAVHKFLLFQDFSLSATMSLLVTPFFGFHCWLLSKNLTTLEYCERPGRASPYDLGIFDNIKSILGEQVWTWPLPLGNPAGDGLVWETCRAKNSNYSSSDQNADEQETGSDRVSASEHEQHGAYKAIEELFGSMHALQDADIQSAWRHAPAAQQFSNVTIAMGSLMDMELPALAELSSDAFVAARQVCLGLLDGQWQENVSRG